jgi:hypothetical protein
MVVLAVSVLAFLHIAVGLANFQPGYPKLEGVAAIIAGMALFSVADLGVEVCISGSRDRMPRHFALGRMVLLGRPRLSRGHLIWASLVIPASTGLAALIRRGRTTRWAAYKR